MEPARQKCLPPPSPGPHTGGSQVWSTMSLGTKRMWCNLSLSARFDSPCFAVPTPFPIAETYLSYKHGDNCSRHWFLFIFTLEVLSDPRPFGLRICFRFLETSSYMGGRDGGEAGKWPGLLMWNGGVQAGAVGSVVHLAPGCSCHLCFGFCTTMSVLRGSSRTRHLARRPQGGSREVPLLQELGTTRSPAQLARCVEWLGVMWHPLSGHW